MFFCPQSFPRQARLPCALLLLFSIAGCASQGPLQPPSLHLPALAESVSAQRIGDLVLVHWTTPARTTDGALVRGAATANICLDTTASSEATSRGAAPARRRRRGPAPAVSPVQPSCRIAAHLAVQPGPSHAEFQVPAAWTAGSDRTLALTIELLNKNLRSAGQSSPVFLAAGTRPEPSGPLRAEPSRGGLLLRWTAEPEHAAAATTLVELKRTALAAPAAPSQAPAAPSQTPAAPSRELVLRPDRPPLADPGGMLDPSVREGDTYIYVAERVRTVQLNGRTLELRSEPSPPLTVLFHDTIAPDPPSGLVLVPGAGFSTPSSIDLSWETDLSPGVAYNVYRSEGATGRFDRLNPDPLPTSSFRDLHVEPSHRYTYRVTAVDARGHESAPSQTAAETLHR